MHKLLPVLICLFIGQPVYCQLSSDRCEVLRGEDVSQFENWLQSRQLSSTAQATRIYRLPVVVHILHTGDEQGTGFNYSREHVEHQIKTLNEDFRRKEGTPGFNTHPDGTDTRIEFALAEIDPDGNPTEGIVRVNMKSVEIPPISGNPILLCSQYSFWDPEKYLNIWCADVGLPPGTLLGIGRFPVSDIGGLPQEDDQDADGVFISAPHFGYTESNGNRFNKGRTLTHEIGHFLGLLHTFSDDINCTGKNDYCEDTPPTSSPTNGCPSEKPVACDGRPVMTENYMDWSYDECMNIFTRNQTTRMHTVLENSPRRKSLTTSDVITRPEDVTGLPGEADTHPFMVYPNPASDKLYIVIDGRFFLDDTISIIAYSISGKVLLSKTAECKPGVDIEVALPALQEKIIIMNIAGRNASIKQLVVLN